MIYKNLFRKLDRTLDKIERSEDLVTTLTAVLRRLVDDFADDLGIVGGRIYLRRGQHYALEVEHPQGKAPPGFRIPASYAPVRELLDRGFVLHRVGDPGVDRRIESRLGVETFAAIAVGDNGRHVVAFTLTPGFDPQRVGHILNTIRHVVNLKFRQVYFEDRVAEVQAIQTSLLPPGPPAFPGFDIWAETVPAEEVGGDLFDFVEVSPRQLGIAVADASGHGLPAALQARDAIIGLRMGVEEHLRITATVEKLNRVIARSALASKFISLFYGELEPSGNFVFVNAGHTPPILRTGRRVESLSRGGMVLGPSPDARYERGFATLEPGSILIAYTDGITEAEGPRGGAFGTSRLSRLLRERSWTSARSLVEEVFRRVRTFTGSDVPVDDQTVLAVIRSKHVTRGPAGARREAR